MMTPRQQELSASHFRGAHAATPHIDCPECQDLGYVSGPSAQYDSERVATGSAQ